MFPYVCPVSNICREYPTSGRLFSIPWKVTGLSTRINITHQDATLQTILTSTNFVPFIYHYIQSYNT
jgi:hypothetical protein